MNGKDLYRILSGLDEGKIEEAKIDTYIRPGGQSMKKRKKMKILRFGVYGAAALALVTAGGLFFAAISHRRNTRIPAAVSTQSETNVSGTHTETDLSDIQQAREAVRAEKAAKETTGIGEPCEIETENLLVYAKEDLGEIYDDENREKVIGYAQPYTAATILWEAQDLYAVRTGDIVGYVPADGSWVTGDDALNLVETKSFEVISRADRTYQTMSGDRVITGRSYLRVARSGKNFHIVSSDDYYTITYQDIFPVHIRKEDVVLGRQMPAVMPWPSMETGDGTRNAFLKHLLELLKQMYSEGETTIRSDFMAKAYSPWIGSGFLTDDIPAAADSAPKDFSVEQVLPGDILIYEAEPVVGNLSASQNNTAIYLGECLVLTFDPDTYRMISMEYGELGSPIARLDLLSFAASTYDQMNIR